MRPEYHGYPFDIRTTSTEGVKVSLSELIRWSGHKNMVTGHEPDLVIFVGIRDFKMAKAGKTTYFLASPELPENGLLRREVAHFLLEKFAWGAHDWGAREVLIQAEKRGEISPVNEPDIPVHDFEREWLAGTEGPSFPL